MVSIPRVTGVLACSFLLSLGLSNAAKADGLSVSDDMYASQSEREGGQERLMGDQDKLRGVESSHMITGRVLSVEGDTYYLQGQDGKALRLHTDQTTRMTGDIFEGARVEAEVNDLGHASSIRSIESTDRRNLADRPS
jgi:hypothetical protein